MNIKQSLVNFKDKLVKTVFKIDVNEHSRYTSPLYDESQFAPYNPDSLVQRKGLKVYDKMMKDEQVAGCLDIKKTLVYGSGWHIEPAEDEDDNKALNEQYQEHANFITECFTNGLKGSFTGALRDILSAFGYGFSLTEMLYYIIPKGKFKGKIGIKQFKTRPPHSFDLHTDKFANITKITQETGGDPIVLDDNELKYFVIYSYNSEFGNPYGRSDLYRAYRAYWSKDIIYKFRNIYLERFGMGVVVAKYPRGLGDDDRDVLEKMIKNIQVKTAFTMPKEVEVDLLETSKKGEEGFHTALDREDKAIAKAVLIPDKLGFTESEGGSYNLGENQFNLFFLIMDNMRMDIAESVCDEQMIKRLIDMNYANVSKYPKFKFNALTQEDKKKLAELVINAIEKKAIKQTEKDEEHLRGYLDLPKRTAEDTIIERPVEPSPFPGGGFGPTNQEEEELPIDGKEGFKLLRKPTVFEIKVNPEKVQKDLDNFEFDNSIEVGKIITKLKDDFVNNVIRKDVVGNKDYKFINNIKLKFLGDLRLAWKDILRKAYRLGEVQAASEIKKKVMKFQVTGLLNLPPKEALRYFDNKAFWITSVEEEYIKKHAQSILYDGIKTGKVTDEVVYDLEEFFDQYKVEQLTPQRQMKPVADIPGRVETIMRTNVNDAYNQGRMATFKDPDVAPFISAYQYSAILDDRTSDICEKLDGRVYNANDPIWKSITPPNHFNCRSMLVPVLTDEEYKVSNKIKVDLPEGFGK